MTNGDAPSPKPSGLPRIGLPVLLTVQLTDIGPVDIRRLSIGASRKIAKRVGSPEKATPEELARSFLAVMGRCPTGLPEAEQRELNEEEVNAIPQSELEEFARQYLATLQIPLDAKSENGPPLTLFAEYLRREIVLTARMMEDAHKSLLKSISLPTLDLIKKATSSSDYIKELLGDSALEQIRKATSGSALEQIKKTVSHSDHVKEILQGPFHELKKPWWKISSFEHLGRDAWSPLDQIRSEMDDSETPAQYINPPGIDGPEPPAPVIQLDVDTKYDPANHDAIETAVRTANATEHTAQAVDDINVLVRASADHITTLSSTLIAMSLDMAANRVSDVEKLSTSLSLARQSLRVAIGLGALSLAVSIAALWFDNQSLLLGQQEASREEVDGQSRDDELKVLRDIRDELKLRDLNQETLTWHPPLLPTSESPPSPTASSGSLSTGEDATTN